MSRNVELDNQIDVLSGRREERMLENIRAERNRLIGQQTHQDAVQKLSRKMQSDLARPSAAREGVLPSVAAMSRMERRNFSVARLLSAISKPKPDPCLETELSDSISEDLGQKPAHGGAWLPLRIRAAGLDTKSNAGGNYAVATDVLSIVDALRAHAKVLQLGATFMTGVKANAALPVESAILAAAFIAENPGTDQTQSDSSFAQRALTPHDAIGVTSVSRQLLAQSSVATENWLVNRFAKAHALLLDKACIHGGASNEPTGILNTAGIGSVAIGTNGGVVAASHLVSLESTVGAANGDSGRLGFLTNTLQRSKMRALPEFTGGATPLWDNDSVLGYPAAASNQVRSDLTKGSANNCSAIIFGDWSALVVCEFFGAFEVTADEYSLKKQGMVELASYGAYDLGVTTLGSFAACLDAI